MSVDHFKNSASAKMWKNISDFFSGVDGDGGRIKMAWTGFLDSVMHRMPDSSLIRTFNFLFNISCIFFIKINICDEDGRYCSLRVVLSLIGI